jgi:N-acetylglucosamine-6-sulfatase
MNHPRVRRSIAPILALAATSTWLTTAPSAAGPLGEATERPEPESAPAIVLIVTDDQRTDTVSRMPTVQRVLVEPGTLFTNAFVTNPLCCPSRASILTGNYSHTTGVYSNDGPYGGYEAFHHSRAERSTIATWLDDAGWRTALIGKYLNHYGTGTTSIPPGWDRWVSFSLVNGRYSNYELNVDGELVPYGTDAADYSTDVFADYAVDAIRETPPDQPVFLYFAPYTPHGPYEPAPRHADIDVDPPELPPSFDERNVSDKPAYVRSLRRPRRAMAERKYENWIRMLGAADDAVGKIAAALRETGRMRDAMIIYTSDNGVLNGEHRLNGKLAPYEESIGVPMIVRYERLASTAPPRSSEPVLNIDLAPTIARAAGVNAPGTDGKSFMPLLRSSREPWRSTFLVEHLHVGNVKIDPPTYCAARSTRWKFVRYAEGFEELYNLRKDPFEMRNVAANPMYRDRLSMMRNRTRTLCDPLPPGMPAF